MHFYFNMLILAAWDAPYCFNIIICRLEDIALQYIVAAATSYQQGAARQATRTPLLTSWLFRLSLVYSRKWCGCLKASLRHRGDPQRGWPALGRNWRFCPPEGWKPSFSAPDCPAHWWTRYRPATSPRSATRLRPNKELTACTQPPTDQRLNPSDHPPADCR